jgi:V/A-type H+-transporting ATPase subunit I
MILNIWRYAYGGAKVMAFKTSRLPAAGLLAALIYWILAGVCGVTLLIGVIYMFQRLWRAPPSAETVTAGAGIRLLEGIIEVVDGTIRFVANTISFIRIAAFALAHAGLFIVVFSLADTLNRMGGGGVMDGLTKV